MKKAIATKKVAVSKQIEVGKKFVNKHVINKKDLDKKFEMLSKIPQPVIELPPKIENSIQIFYNFEAFIAGRVSRGSSSTPSISLYKAGTFSINSEFLKELEKMGEFTHVKLFFDRGSNSIGISFKSYANEGCLCKLITPKVGNDKRFSSRHFFIYYGLDLTKITGKYQPKKVYINREIGDIWVLSLNKHAY